MEVILSLVVVSILVGILLPAMTPRPVHGKRISCVSNIKQVGLAFRMWANDHGDRFPWQVSMSEMGTLEFAESRNVFLHFATVSNELNSPKVLACSSDTKVSRESEWTNFNNAHLSYFVGLDSNEANPQTILTGDRNLLGGQVASNGIMRFDAQSAASWGTGIHKSAGNIGLADGSAAQVTGNGLHRQLQSSLQSTSLAALRFSIPKPN